MDPCDHPVMHRLETALGELECEFHYLLNDVNIDTAHKLRNNPIVLQNLRAASEFVTAAGRLLREKPVAQVLELADHAG